MTNNWYDKNYKKILILPVAVLIISLAYLFFFYNTHGDLIYRDISLSGGTTITLQGDYDQQQLENDLISTLEDVQVREIGDLSTGKQTRSHNKFIRPTRSFDRGN
jgi:preprotein translocase subunit SecF